MWILERLLIRRLLLCGAASLIILGAEFLSLDATRAQEGGAQQTLDLVLLIDNSGSMEWVSPRTDTSQLRIIAAQGLVGYLAVKSEQIVSNVGVVLFGTVPKVVTSTLVTVAPEGSDNYLKGLVRSENLGFTDFAAALTRANGLLLSHKTQNPCAVVLFTDGRPEVKSPMTAKDVGNEFEKIATQVDILRNRRCKFYVMVVGDAIIDQETWRNLAEGSDGSYGRLFPPLKSIDVLPDYFHEILCGLVGLVNCSGSDNKVMDRDITSDTTEYIKVPPYLHAITFFVINSGAPLDVSFYQPDGQRLLLTPNVVSSIGSNDLAYNVVNPQPSIVGPPAKDWTIRVSLRGSGKAHIWAWADKFFLKVRPQFGSFHLEGDLLTIRAFLADTQIAPNSPVHSVPGYNLNLVAQLFAESDPGKVVGAIDLVEQIDGTFAGTYAGKLARGRYAVKVEATAENVRGIVDTQSFPLYIGGIPRIAEITITEAEVGKFAPIQLKVGSFESVYPGGTLTVTAVITDSAGLSFLVPIPLTQTGTSNQYEGVLGITSSTGQLGSFTVSGNYQATIRLVGKTSDGFFSFDGTQDPTFRVIQSFHVREAASELPSLGNAEISDIEVGQVAKVSVPILHFEKASTDLKITAVVALPDGRRNDPIVLTPAQIATGELGRFDAEGTYQMTLTLMGTAKDGTQLTPPPVTASFVVKEQGWVTMVRALFAGILLLTIAMGFTYRTLIYVPLTFVIGKLEVTNPDRTRDNDIDLTAMNKKLVTLGNPGDIELAKDPGVIGIEAKIEGRQKRGREATWWLSKKQGGKFEKPIQLFGGDKFAVGKYDITYLNDAAKREAERDLIDNYA